MLYLLRLLFTGDPHRHRWEILREDEIYDSCGRCIVATRYVLQCKHCGKLRRVNINN